MGLAKKLARRATRKGESVSMVSNHAKATKKLESTVRRVVKIEKAAQGIARLNEPTIFEYCSAYIMPMCVDAMREVLGFGGKRISEVFAELMGLIKSIELTTYNHANGVRGTNGRIQHFLSLTEVREGLEAETGFKYELARELAVEDMENKDDVSELAMMYARNNQAKQIDGYIVVMLAAIWCKHGVSRARLEKVNAAIHARLDLPRSKWDEIVERLETRTRSWIASDGERDQLEFQIERDTMNKLRFGEHGITVYGSRAELEAAYGREYMQELDGRSSYRTRKGGM